MEEDKKWWKKVLAVIGGFLAGVITFIIYGTINGKDDRDTRESAERVRDNIDTATSANRDAGESAERLEAGLDKASEINGDIKSSTEHCLDIIRRAKQESAQKED